MSEAYAKIPVLKTKTRAVAHSNAIATEYEEITKGDEALTQMHEELATWPRKIVVTNAWAGPGERSPA